MEGYCAIYTRTPHDPNEPRTLSGQRAACEALAAEMGWEMVPICEWPQEPQDDCVGLLEPYLDQIADQVIAAQVERDGDQEAALSRWFGEGGR